MEINTAALTATRDRLADEAQAILDRSADSLSPEDSAEFDRITGELENVVKQIEHAQYIERAVNVTMNRQEPVSADAPRSILDVSPEQLEGLQRAIEGRKVGEFEYGYKLDRSALTTSTFGAPRDWGSNIGPAPRLLYQIAKIPVQRVNAGLAAAPKFTLPTAVAGASEGASLSEYASSTASNVTLARYGRWTDLTEESRLGTTSASLIGMHQVGIALDLEKVVVAQASTDAGTAVAFSSDVPGNVRKALAQVRANTASGDPSYEFVLVNPADAALLQAVQPNGGETIGQGFPKFSGANVFESNFQTAGFVTVANLAAGLRFFEATSGIVAGSFIDPKTGVMTVSSHVIAGLATVLTGYSISVDVVTP